MTSIVQGVSPSRLGAERADALSAASAGFLGATADAPALAGHLMSLGDEDVAILFTDLMRVRAAAEGLAVRALAEVVHRGVVAASTATDVGSWARARCRAAGVGLTPSLATAMRRTVELAGATSRRGADVVFAAAATGRVPVHSAPALGRELERLAPAVDPAVFDTAAAELIEWAAQGASAVDLARAAQAIAASYGEETFEEEQARVHRRRHASAWRPDGAGGWEMRVRTDNEGKAVLDAALGALAGPVPRASVSDAAGTEAAVVDARTPGQRRHDALLEMASVVATDPGWASRHRPASAAKAQVTVTMAYDALATRVRGVVAGAADSARDIGCGLDGYGTPLTPSTVRRLACDADLIPAVLASDGAILDWGRRRRLATRDQIAYLRQRDKGCVFAGCDRPPAWCDAHHLAEWEADRGDTDVGNLALLCRRHHTVVHSHRLRGRLGSDGVVRWQARAATGPILVAA